MNLTTRDLLISVISGNTIAGNLTTHDALASVIDNDNLGGNTLRISGVNIDGTSGTSGSSGTSPTYIGNWDGNITYSINDIVYSQGPDPNGTYISTNTGNLNNPPEVGGPWALISLNGTNGTSGTSWDGNALNGSSGLTVDVWFEYSGSSGSSGCLHFENGILTSLI